MGFRDFLKVNRALLAKTAWRLCNNQEELWCKILKGIYFPDKDFMQAKKGSRASGGVIEYLRRELLKKYLIWKIIKGDRLSLFVDKWLPEDIGFCLQPRVLTIFKKLKVADIIVHTEWNFENVEGVLNDADKEAIRRVKIPLTVEEERHVWQRRKDGMYSVKMGYKVAREERDLEKENGASTSYRTYKKLWNSIWQVKVPPKTNHFLWRAAGNALATKETLYKRKCSTDPTCCICKDYVENIEHNLFLCP